MQGRELAPMGYKALLNRVLERPAPISLRLQEAEIVSSSMSELPKGRASWFETDITTEMTVRHIGLIRGGWLPAGVALTGGNLVLPDRCTLTELEGRFKPGRSASQARDFVEWFDSPETRINPMLLAIEGNTRTFPTRAEMHAQIDRAAALFRKFLPKATVLGDRSDMLDAAIKVAEEQRAESERTIAFLLSIAPRLKHPVSRRRLESVLHAIADAAHQTGLSLKSLPFVCALSAAAVNKGPNPAKGALKLTEASYDRRMAFNAMADMRSLTMFMTLLGLFPNERPMLCTGDKDLALVWCGLNLSRFDYGDGPPTVKSAPLAEFLPGPAGQIYKSFLERG